MTLDQFQYAVKQSRQLFFWWQVMPEARCPNCRASLEKAPIVIPSRHCPACGGRVLDEGKSASREFNLTTVKDYTNELRPYRIALFWLTPLTGLAFVFSLISYMFITFDGLSLGVWWSQSLGVWWSQSLGAVMLGWTFLGIPLLFVIAHIVLTTQAKSNEVLKCQYCGYLLLTLSSLVVCTKRCLECGQQHLCDELMSVDALKPRFTLAEYLSLRARRYRIQRNWVVACFLVWLVTAIAYAPDSSLQRAYLICHGLLLVMIPTYFVVRFVTSLFHPLRCPHCRKKPRSFGNVIASKYCDRCGERVIVEPSEPDPCR